MTTDIPTESERLRAQKLAYRAMEADDHSRALSLCLEAIKFDPNCVDARTIMASAFKKARDRVEHLRFVVETAQEQLGGQSYIEANKGDLWGLLETRPYMRARHYLAQTLNEAGMVNEAITEYEALLGLNPNDNQGLRYVPIALYLKTSNLDAARRLLSEYNNDDTVFAWSAVLERFFPATMREHSRRFSMQGESIRMSRTTCLERNACLNKCRITMGPVTRTKRLCALTLSEPHGINTPELGSGSREPVRRTRRESSNGGTYTMEAKIESNELVIRIPLEKPKPSSSGKTLIVASTGGNFQTDIEINGKPVFVGLNAYIKK